MILKKINPFIYDNHQQTKLLEPRKLGGLRKSFFDQQD